MGKIAVTVRKCRRRLCAGEAVHLHPYPGGSAGKESAYSARDLGSIPGLGRSPEGKGYPLQYSGLENSMDCIVHGVSKSWTGQRDFHFHTCILTLEHKPHATRPLFFLLIVAFTEAGLVAITLKVFVSSCQAALVKSQD